MLVTRMRKELEDMSLEPPPGISCWPKGDAINDLEATIRGPEGTPYERGLFKLAIAIPDRYPIEPPKVNFVTKIYHPNIDEGGRICLDTLVPQQSKGQWRPSLSVSKVLVSIQALLSKPNPDDGLVVEITHQCKHNYPQFEATARDWTRRYAIGDVVVEELSATTSVEKAMEDVPPPAAGPITAHGIANISPLDPPTISSEKKTSTPKRALSSASTNKPKPDIQTTKPTDAPLFISTESIEIEEASLKPKRKLMDGYAIPDESTPSKQNLGPAKSLSVPAVGVSLNNDATSSTLLVLPEPNQDVVSTAAASTVPTPTKKRKLSTNKCTSPY